MGEERRANLRRSGQRGATSHDVAKLAGVSQPTVSRALRGDPRISEETRRKVIEAALKIDYTIDFAARSLVQRSTTIIGIAIAHLTNPYFPELLDPLIEELESNGYRTVLLSTRQSEDTLFEQLTDGSVDGAILASCAKDSLLPAMLARRRLPFVLINRNVYGADADRCLVDNHGGGIEAARAVLGLGHRRIAMILGGDDASTSLEREAGFRDAMAEVGVRVDPKLVRRGDFTTRFGYEALVDLLESGERFSAVLCANDVIAVGALNAAAAKGVDVPGALTILGYDDIPLAAWHRIQLSTVRQDTQEMGRTGARMLIDRLANPDLPRQTRWLKPKLVLRATHAPPPPGF